MKDLIINSFGKAYSKCNTPEDVNGVGKAFDCILKEMDLPYTERRELIHKVLSKTAKLGFRKEAFPATNLKELKQS